MRHERRVMGDRRGWRMGDGQWAMGHVRWAMGDDNQLTMDDGQLFIGLKMGDGGWNGGGEWILQNRVHETRDTI